MGGGGGGGNISDYVLLVVVSYTSRGVWGHAPQKLFWYFCALRQLLVQSDAKIYSTVVS